MESLRNLISKILMLKNENMFVKIVMDTAENEFLEFLGKRGSEWGCQGASSNRARTSGKSLCRQGAVRKRSMRGDSDCFLGSHAAGILDFLGVSIAKHTR